MQPTRDILWELCRCGPAKAAQFLSFLFLKEWLDFLSEATGDELKVPEETEGGVWLVVAYLALQENFACIKYQTKFIFKTFLYMGATLHDKSNESN